MKKYNLGKLYESSCPPTDINVLWVDINSDSEIPRAIHSYNKSIGQWEPMMVSVEYLMSNNKLVNNNGKKNEETKTNES